MKAVILAGGFGTRLSEETLLKPKPMVEIGSSPILWHIMKIYSSYGVNDFIICLGYKGYVIKEYFANYYLYHSDISFDMSKNEMKIHDNYCDPWKVTLVDTGAETMTGGRLKRVRKYIGEETFCFTYGDCVADININNLIECHRNNGALATLTAVNPPGRYGALDLDRADNRVIKFMEKTQDDQGWINGGFFVLEPGVFDYIDGDGTCWEIEPVQCLSAEGKLNAYKHNGFWLPMDTLRDKMRLEDLWSRGNAPWKVWNDESQLTR